MSTIPGSQSWRDAGLDDPGTGEPVSLIDEVTQDAVASPEEYRPGTARPDLIDEADEADVADQAVVVPEVEDSSEL